MIHNACISLISSRTKCLPLCLESIHKFYNYRYNYPIYVHYFDDIYDDFKVDTPNVEFIQVPYETPKHIPESELFYNKKDNAYAKRFFPKSRKGYLHMCNFIVNMYKYPNTKIHNHDYVIVFDDESGFVKEPYDFVDRYSAYDMAAMITSRRLKNGKVPQNHIDTREGLSELVWKFILTFRLGLGYLLGCLEEDTIGLLPWSDGYLIRTKMFETDLWENWKGWVNNSGGIYKHRWGDNEIYSLFYMMFSANPIPDMGIVEDGYLKQDLFKNISLGARITEKFAGGKRHRKWQAMGCTENKAPGIKNNDR